MKDDNSLFNSPEAEARADARAEADAREGRVVPHEKVRAWLESLGEAERLPRPRSGD